MIKGLTPPFAIAAVKAAIEKAGKDLLFDGEDELFIELASQANVYAEYGCGASTRWMAKHTSAEIYSVDTSEFWIETVRSSIGTRKHVVLDFVDLGPLGDWGRPITYAKREAISCYTEGPWRQDKTPDLVLIDGRFRVACFFSTLLSASSGTKIIFDDYRDRPHYHCVEEILRPARVFERQAMFVVPEKIDRLAIQQEYQSFLYVMD